MERIQIAIEKARSKRLEQDNVAAKPSAQEAELPPRKEKSPVLPEREVAWASLPAFHPDAKYLARKRIVAYQTGQDAAPYDVMRTKLLHIMRSNKWRRVAITSPGANSGKTMTCLNLAFSIARQSNLHTMLIDLDMRRPSTAKTLGLQDHMQFSEALRGNDPAEEHMVRYRKNLAFALNHSPTHHPAELLHGPVAAQVLDDLEAAYTPDVMIFDMPPMFAGDDTMAFLDQVDCVLLIGEAEKTTLEELDKCQQDLSSRTNVLGVMLNKCRYLSSQDGYGNTYGY